MKQHIALKQLDLGDFSVTNPYLQDDGEATLQDSWFCFLDILGFKEILKANDHSCIQEFHRLLRDGRHILEGPADEADWFDRDFHALTFFTDNIVLGLLIIQRLCRKFFRSRI